MYCDHRLHLDVLGRNCKYFFCAFFRLLPVVRWDPLKVAKVIMRDKKMKFVRKILLFAFGVLDVFNHVTCSRHHHYWQVQPRTSKFTQIGTFRSTRTFSRRTTAWSARTSSMNLWKFKRKLQNKVCGSYWVSLTCKCRKFKAESFPCHPGLEFCVCSSSSDNGDRSRSFFNLKLMIKCSSSSWQICKTFQCWKDHLPARQIKSVSACQDRLNRWQMSHWPKKVFDRSVFTDDLFFQPCIRTSHSP